jgi:ABC-type glutathione transport system ATPase component
MSEPVQPVARLTGVTKTFGSRGEEVRAVDGVSLEIAPGETLGLIGESGSGKSTLGRIVLGLLPPDEGEVEFEGVPIRARSRRDVLRMRSRLQVVFQEPFESLNPRHRVRDIIAEPLVVQGRRGREVAARVDEVLGMVGLDRALGEKFPGQLSGGQQQRVGVARAIVGEPRLIVLDEPTASLDRTIRRQLTDVLMQLQQMLGLSYLLITHDIASVRRMSTRIAVMYRGSLVEVGETQRVLTAPEHPYTRTLISAELPPRPGARRERTEAAVPGSTR